MKSIQEIQWLKDCSEGLPDIEQTAIKRHVPMTNEALIQQLLESGPTRKHFRQVADIIKSIKDPAEKQRMAQHHADIFAAQNPRFNHEKWHQWIGTKNHVAESWQDEVEKASVRLSKMSKKKRDKEVEKAEKASAKANKVKWVAPPRKEETELDELSKKTLGSYAKKAKNSLIGDRGGANSLGPRYNRKGYVVGVKRSRIRSKGIDRAIDKLAKEEEQIDELKKSTLLSYRDKAGPNRKAGQAAALVRLKGSYYPKASRKDKLGTERSYRAEETVDEATFKLNPKKKGMWKGKSIEDIKAAKSSAKKSGNVTREREATFAINAKHHFQKEDVDEAHRPVTGFTDKQERDPKVKSSLAYYADRIYKSRMAARNKNVKPTAAYKAAHPNEETLDELQGKDAFYRKYEYGHWRKQPKPEAAQKTLPFIKQRKPKDPGWEYKKPKYKEFSKAVQDKAASVRKMVGQQAFAQHEPEMRAKLQDKIAKSKVREKTYKGNFRKSLQNWVASRRTKNEEIQVDK